MKQRPPFLILKEFLSPLECENVLSSIRLDFPNVDVNDNPIKTIIKAPVIQNRVWQRMELYFEIIEKYYQVEIDSIGEVDIEWYPEESIKEQTRCENSIYINSKWQIVNDNDFCMVVFLKDYNDSKNFDIDFECYGGKLNMVNHGFGFNPERGTAIIFPGNQNFINLTDPPKYGDALQIRTHITTVERYKYSPSLFPGNFKTWF